MGASGSSIPLVPRILQVTAFRQHVTSHLEQFWLCSYKRHPEGLNHRRKKLQSRLLKPKDSSTTLSSTRLRAGFPLPTSGEAPALREKLRGGKIKVKVSKPKAEPSPPIAFHVWVYTTGICCTSTQGTCPRHTSGTTGQQLCHLLHIKPTEWPQWHRASGEILFGTSHLEGSILGHAERPASCLGLKIRHGDTLEERYSKSWLTFSEEGAWAKSSLIWQQFVLTAGVEPKPTDVHGKSATGCSVSN